MKTPINPLTSKPDYLSRIKILTLAAALTVPAATGLAQTLWTDGTADYNIPGDWNGTYNDGSTVNSPNPNCDNDEGTNSIILIQPGDPAWYHGDTLAGNGANTSGAYLQTGSTNATGWPDNGNWLRMGIASGAYGSYILSNGLVNVAGQTHLGENGTGYLEVDGGVYNTGYNGNPGMCCGYGDFGPGTGTLVLNNGTINNINNETWFGESANGNHDSGYFYMNGGTYNANNWFVFGRNDGGFGYGVMTGGTINFTGGGQFLVGGGGAGTLIQSGGIINVYNQYLVPQSGGNSSDVGTNILSGTAVLNAHDWVAIGRNGGAGLLVISNGASITRDNASDNGANFTVGSGGAGVVNQNGGNITNLAGETFIGETAAATWNLNSGVASLGTLAIGYAGGGNGTLNVNGGTLLISSLAIGQGGVGKFNLNTTTVNAGPISMGVNNAANGTLSLNGGTLQTPGITVGSASAVTTLNLNGGTLQATANNQNFISGLTLAFAGPATTVIDSQNYNITVAQQIQDNGGGLIKQGSGTLTLSGQNSYSGDTVVSNGTLNIVTGTSAGGNYVFNDNTVLGVLVQSAGQQLQAQQNMTLGNSTGATVNFNLGNFGNPPSAPLTVGGTLTVNGTITINVAASLAQVGLVTLIQSANPIAGSGTFVLGPLPPGISGTLVVGAKTVSLNISSANFPAWAGLAGGTWDTGADTNWINLGTGLPTTFQNGDVTIFNDGAPGTTNVNITTTVSPYSVSVNDTNLSYSFYGSGSISGSSSLTKGGPNSLAILNANSYTGPTVVSGGTLLVSNLANSGSPSAIGSSTASPANLVLSGGTLDYVGPAVSINRGYTAADTNGAVDLIIASNLTVSGSVATVPGAGFIKSGPAQLSYTGSGVSTLSDALGYQIQSGTVSFGGSGTNNGGGNFDIAVSNNLTATLLVTNNVTLSLSGGGVFDIADSEGIWTNNGTVNISGGAINLSSSYSTFVGQNSNSTAILNISGGSYNANNWIAIGRDNGTGTVNISGTGALNMVNGNGGNLDIGNSGGFGGQNGTAVINQTGGSISNILAGTWLGEGSGSGTPSGTWNMTGGTAWLGYLGIGYNGDGTGQMSISGNASVLVENSPCEVGRAQGGSGLLTIGSTNGTTGSLTLNSGNDFNVGNNGSGVLVMLPGGTLSTLGTIYLTRGSAATGYVYLNSGSKIITGYLNNGDGFGAGQVPAVNSNSEAFYFNGGTLQAATGSAYFIQPYLSAIIQTNGAIIDDGGFNINALCSFADAPGSTAGLTKLDTGTLILSAASTYVGTTVISNGTLIASNSLVSPITVESGATLLSATSVAGAVTVASGGTLGGNTGGINTENFDSTLSLAAGSTTFMAITPASNDAIAGLTGVSYGGSLVVSNMSSTPLTVGSQFKLFNSSGSPTGNFASVTLLPQGTATFTPSTGILTITSNGQAPVLNHPYVSGGSLVLTASGGTPDGNLWLLSSTNLLIPIANWPTNYTGAFDSNGDFSNAIPVSTTNKAMFFILKTP